MQRPLKITSHDFTLDQAFETEIHDKAIELEKFYSHLIGCEVTVHAPALAHHKKGGPFVVSVRLAVPGKEIVADHHPREELSQAIREAFAAARRELEDYTHKQRGA